MDAARIAADGLLESIDPDTGEPPKSVLKDATSLREVWHQMDNADQPSSYNRSLVRQISNGHPPFDQAKRKEEGTDGLFNVNTGTSRLILDEAKSGFMDIFTGDRNLIEIPLDADIPDEQRIRAQRLIEDETTKLLREWDCYDTTKDALCLNIVTDGVGILSFDSDDSWTYSAYQLKDFKFLREAVPVSNKCSIGVLRKKMRVGELYRHIENEKEAEKKGWNVDGVRKLIHDVGKRYKNDRWRDWESLEEDLKSNELNVSTLCDTVEVLWAFVQEFESKKVTLCMGSSHGIERGNETAGGAAEEFLFKRPQSYKSANELYQIFPYSTGEGNLLYTIRGLGYFIYQACNAENVMFCRMMDAARIGSTLVYRPRTVEEMEDLSFHDFGMGLITPPGLDPVERAAPNLTQTMGPALELIDKKLNQQTAGLSGGAADFPGERANEANVSFNLEQINKMNSFAITLTYAPLDRHWREFVKRVFVEGLDDGDGLSKRMRARLEKAGVTKEIWERIDLDGVKARRILMGSTKTGRALLLRQIRGLLIGDMDDQGRKQSSWDIASELLGREYADGYFGQPGETRTTVDHWMARSEINDLREGVFMEALDGQDHLIHLRAKIEALLDTKDGVEDGTLDLVEYTQSNLPLYENVLQHLEMLVVDPSLEEEAAQIRKQVQRLGEFFVNGQRAMMKQQREAQAQNVAQEEPQELTPLQIQMEDERRKDLANEAEIARKDRANAAQIARDSVKEDILTAKKVQQR